MPWVFQGCQDVCIKRGSSAVEAATTVFQDALIGTTWRSAWIMQNQANYPPKQTTRCFYRLSAAKDSEFPLAPVSLNITKWTLQMVRERKLTSAAKKQQSAVTAASDFYVGTFYTLYNYWKDKKCTMADSGFVLKEIEKRACSNVMNMVRRAGNTL